MTAQHQSTPAAASQPDPRRWPAFAVVLSATLLSVLDFLIVNIALPSIRVEMNATDAEMQLTVAGYGLAFAVCLITGGRLGDIYGRKKLFMGGMAGFTPVAEYGSRKPVCPEEIGSVEDVRYVLSPELNPFTDAGASYNGSGTAMVSTSGTSADVYPILYFGKEAFGTVPLKGAGAITPMVLNPGKPDKSDPLGQRGYVSWKTYFTAVILNQSWMARLEVAVTAL